MLRNNSGLLAGLVLAFLLCIIPVFPGCSPRTVSTIDPTKKVDAAGLAIETATVQNSLDTEAADVQRRAADYASHVAAANAKLTAAGDELTRQQNVRRQALAFVGGALQNVLAGHALDPTTYTSAAFSLLALFGGGGAVVDSVKKQGIVNRLRGATPDTPAAVAGTIAPAEPVNVPKAA